MKRVIIYVMAALFVVAGLAAAVPSLSRRARQLAVDFKIINADTGEVMSSATYQRFALRRRAVENMQKTLVALVRAESLFLADSGRPFTTLPQSERYAVPNDPENLLFQPQFEGDRWSARMTSIHTTVACSITAMLDTSTGRYHAGRPLCSGMIPEEPPAPVAASGGQDQPPKPRVVDLVSHPRPVNNKPPPMPWIQTGVCPGRDCKFGQWTACSTIVVTRDKRHTSPAVFTLRRGDEFTALTGDVHVSKPGLVVFSSTFTGVLEKEDAAGPVVTMVLFTPADTLYPLFHLADRQMVLWFRGAADTGADFWRPDPAVYRPDALRASKLVESPTTTWWIRMRNSSGQEGWAEFDDATILTRTPEHVPESEKPGICQTETG